jgi:type IX secretion system PorP/SprF family membrane protein
MKYTVYIFALLLFSTTVRAQELQIFEQYLQNTYYLSPASVGIKPCLEIIGTDRHQWTGISSSPNNQSIGVYSRLNLFPDRQTYGFDGVGGNIYVDRNGPTSTTRFQLDYAHHVTIYKKKRSSNLWRMAMGLGLTGYQHKLDESELLPEQIADPIFTGTSNSVTAFNLDGGLLFYNKHYTAGVTAANMLPSTKSDFGNVFNRNYFAFFAYNKRNRDGLGFSPSAVFKLYGKMKQIDLNGKFYLSENFHAGLSYRHNLDSGIGKSQSAMVFLGLELEHLSFGYAFDYTLRRIGQYNYGSHSIMVGYRMCKRDINCPAYL